jgi:hypothetical protein
MVDMKISLYALTLALTGTYDFDFADRQEIIVRQMDAHIGINADHNGSYANRPLWPEPRRVADLNAAVPHAVQPC